MEIRCHFGLCHAAVQADRELPLPSILWALIAALWLMELTSTLAPSILLNKPTPRLHVQVQTKQVRPKLSNRMQVATRVVDIRRNPKLSRPKDELPSSPFLRALTAGL